MKKMAASILTIALLLSTLFCVGMLTASAADGSACTSTAGCDGTYTNGFCPYCSGYEEPSQDGDGYYEIDNAGKLYWFAVKVNISNAAANAKLTADIEVTSSVLGTRYWTPIGVSGEGFSGIFDGQGYTISHIACDTTITSGDVHASLFYVIGEEGVVKNVGILDSTFKGSITIGSVVAFNYGTVQNCFSEAAVTGIPDSSHSNYFGGLVGFNEGLVENCYFAGTIVAERGFVGGVAGANEGTLRNCYYNATNHIGDAFGAHSSVAVEEKLEGKASADFADGTVCALVGFHVRRAATCTQETECKTCSGKEDINPSNHTGEAHINGFWPCCGGYQPATQKGVGENGMPLYEISNAGELYWFAELVNKKEAVEHYPLTTCYLNAKLVADITVNEGRIDESGSYIPVSGETARRWSPIIGYRGHFDGNGKTLSGIYLANGGSGVGLFASIGELIYESEDLPSSGSVKNLGITNSYFEGVSYVGALVGSQYLGTSIENCWSDALVKGSTTLVGGLVGHGRGGTLKNSTFYGVIRNDSYPNSSNIIGAAFPVYQVINCYSPYGENDWNGSGDQPNYKNWYKSREAFASGEVAVLLNKEIGYHYFGQLLGTDVGPRIGGPAVYENVQLNCTEYGYANTPIGNEAHIPAGAWSSDSAQHWHTCTVEGCDEKLNVTAHVHDNACDTDCDICGETRTTAHVHDNACDIACNICGETRTTAHVHDNACDTACNICGEVRTTAHVYDNACDTACNICGEARTTAHVYDNACDTACNVCNEARTVPAHEDANEDYACDACNAQLPKKGLSGGAGIGIGVGATATLLIGGFSLFWFVIKKKKWSDLIGIFKQ